MNHTVLLFVALFAQMQEPERVGPGVTAPKILSRREPEFTPGARDAGVQGKTVLTLVVDVDGLPKNIQVISPLPFGLDEAAVRAVHEWRFKPGMKNGNPVPIQATVEVNFRLMDRYFDEKTEQQRTEFNGILAGLRNAKQTEESRAKTLARLEKLSKEKFPAAMVMYAELLLDGSIPDPSAKSKADALIDAAAKKKFGGALYWKAKQMLEAGDQNRGIPLMRDAAYRGSGRAQQYLATGYANGQNGLPQNESLSKQYLRQCAAARTPACQWDLAQSLAREYPKPDSSKHLEAISWAMLAGAVIPEARAWADKESKDLAETNRNYVRQLSGQLVN